MITVSQEQLDTVEYLLEQSAQGNHVLFEKDLVRQVFASPSTPMSQDQAYEVEHHIEKLISLENIEKQKAYLEVLPELILHRVVLTYFNIVENNLFEKNGSERH
jgi:ribosomal protein L17